MYKHPFDLFAIFFQLFESDLILKKIKNDVNEKLYCGC